MNKLLKALHHPRPPQNTRTKDGDFTPGGVAETRGPQNGAISARLPRARTHQACLQRHLADSADSMQQGTLGNCLN